MRRALVLIAALVLAFLLVLGQAFGVQTPADIVIRSSLGETVLESAVTQRGGVDYLPLQDAAAAFGAAAYWIQDAIVMRLLTESQSVELTVGDHTAVVDGQPVELDSAPIKVDGRLYLSIDAFTYLLGVDAEWSVDRSQLVLRESVPRLVGMAVEKLTDGRQAVVLTLSKPIAGKLTEAVLTGPDRYYVDIPGVRMGLEEDDRTLHVDDAILRSVRASQNLSDPPVVRVVLDLNRSFRYWARKDPANPRRILIEPAFRIYNAELVRNPNGGLIRIISDAGPVPYQINYYSEPDRIVVDLMNSFLVRDAFEAPNDDHYFVSCIRASQNKTDVVRVVIELRRSYPYTPYHPEGRSNELCIAFGKMIYEPEIRETDTAIDIVIRSSQDNRGEIWTDPPTSDKMRLAVDFENSFFGFDPSQVSIENELIAGFRAGRFDGHTVRMVFDLKRFNGYSLIKNSGPETIIRLPKTRESVLFGRTIVIDPGHGSFPSADPNGDPGASRTMNGQVVYEKDLNLKVALKLRDLLVAAGANVVLTRDSDVGLSISQRYMIANEAKADAFISIHHNSSLVEWTETSGLEVYHKSGDSSSKRLAESLGQAIVKRTGQNLAYVGLHRAFLLGVLEGAKVTSVLIEVGFMNCLEELKLLVDDSFQNEVARGIYDGLVSFFSNDQRAQSAAAFNPSQPASASSSDFLTQLTSNLPDIDVERLEEEAKKRQASESR